MKGYNIIDSRLNEIEPIIKRWIQNILDYCQTYYNERDKNEKDAPYWYNERATLSTLAGAVWKAGGIALEEYKAKKREGKIKKEGRVDFWFQWDNKSYVAEAKQSWMRINEESIEKKMITRLYYRMKNARQDVKKVDHKEGFRLGIVFFVPIIAYDNRHKSDMLLNLLLKKIKKSYPHDLEVDLLAWCFPGCVRVLEWKKISSIYPGVVLLINSYD